VHTLLSAQLFLVIKNMDVGPHPLTRLNWSLAISSCIQERNCSYEGAVSRMYLKFRNNHWPSCMQFQFYTIAEVLPDMAETMDPLHKLRTGEQPKTKVKCVFNYWISAAGPSGYTLLFSKNAHLTFTLTVLTAQCLYYVVSAFLLTHSLLHV